MQQEVKELQSLPLSDLISAPLNAIVKAQADSAVSTAEFIERVGFIKKDKKKSAVLGNETRADPASDVRVAAVQVKRLLPNMLTAATDAVGDPTHPHGMHAKTSANEPKGLTEDAEPNDDQHPEGIPIFQPAQPAKYGDPREIKERVEIPFLSMLNIPSVVIDQMTWDFNVRLVSTSQLDTTFAFSNETTIENKSIAGLNLGLFNVGGSLNVTSTTKTDFERRYGETHEAEYNMKISIKATQAALPKGIERLLSIAEKIATNNDSVRQLMANS
jgi:hypothetical protein